jgi:hypothetical protein
MLQYTCDWCGKPRATGDKWILGLAADRIGKNVRRRELEILKSWSSYWARHPLAVHFCSPEHRDDYVRTLFRQKQRGSTRIRKRNGPSAPAALSVSADISIGPQTTSRSTKRVAASQQTPARLPEPRTETKPNSKLRFSRSDKLRAHGMGIKL